MLVPTNNPILQQKIELLSWILGSSSRSGRHVDGHPIALRSRRHLLGRKTERCRLSRGELRDRSWCPRGLWCVSRSLLGRIHRMFHTARKLRSRAIRRSRHVATRRGSHPRRRRLARVCSERRIHGSLMTLERLTSGARTRTRNGRGLRTGSVRGSHRTRRGTTWRPPRGCEIGPRVEGRS